MGQTSSRNDFSQIARNCERAVVTAYTDLRQLGSDDLAAYTACTTAEWIDHHVTRPKPGATQGCDCRQS